MAVMADVALFFRRARQAERDREDLIIIIIIIIITTTTRNEAYS